MKSSSASARESIPLRFINIALMEDAARDLEVFSEKVIAPGHWPSWSYPLPDGLALCVRCWRPITAAQLGIEPCSGARREKLAEYLKVGGERGGDEWPGRRHPGGQ